MSGASESAVELSTRLDRLCARLLALRDARRLASSDPLRGDLHQLDELDEIERLVDELAGEAPSRGPTAAPLPREAVLSYIIANVPHSVFWKDREGRFLGGNQNLLDDLGLERLDQLVGRTDYDLGFPREQADFFRRCDLDVMESGRALLDIEESQDQADGTHTLLTSKVPLRDPAGQVQGMLGIYVDITERKRMEQELRAARDAAEAASRARADFLTVASHELRTPLTLILGPLDAVLARPDLPGAVRADLERVSRNAGRLLVLVNDLLAWRALEAGQLAPRWELCDVGELLSQLLADAEPAAGRAGLSLSLSVAPELAAVPVDRAQLEKIALNLVANALKFTPAGGWVRVTAEPDGEGDRWVLAVADSGPGVPRDQQPLLFRRFQQLDGAPRPRHEGSGIGLALVKELAHCMGGEVGVQSEAGAGARFWVRLPRAAPPASGAGAPASVEPTPPGPRVPSEHARRLLEGIAAITADSEAGGDRQGAIEGGGAADPRPRVLVADDQAELRAWLASLLSTDYQVQCVADGRAALAAARARPPAVILADVMMPELDGLALVRELKADPTLARVPVLLLTARSSREQIVAGLDQGADDYLPKPFSPAELLARVRAALRLSEAWAERDREHRALSLAHEELRAAQAQLVQSAKVAAVGTLVAGLCHELNNPLGAILLNTQVLRGQASPAPSGGSADGELASRALAAIERQARRAATLVAGLLDFVRKKQPVREPLPLARLLERVGLLLGTRLRAAGQHLHLELPATGLPAVHGSTQEIETALLNLLGNALDVTPAGGEVVLTVRGRRGPGGEGVELAVRDRGPGIPAAVLPHVFDPFFTTKPVGEGTGLGLALARKIAEDHGGRIDIDTGAEGTTVRILLPAATGAVRPALPGPPGAPA